VNIENLTHEMDRNHCIRQQRGIAPLWSAPQSTAVTDRCESYVRFHTSVAPCGDRGPMSFERWSEVFDKDVYAEEIKRFDADLFLASLHPDGGNLAGFHGVKAEGEEAEDEA
jgi:hypothetical protein